MIPVLPTLEFRQKSRHFGGIRMKQVRWRTIPPKIPPFWRDLTIQGWLEWESRQNGDMNRDMVSRFGGTLPEESRAAASRLSWLAKCGFRESRQNPDETVGIR
jgi:hypothetical protein